VRLVLIQAQNSLLAQYSLLAQSGDPVLPGPQFRDAFIAQWKMCSHIQAQNSVSAKCSLLGAQQGLFLPYSFSLLSEIRATRGAFAYSADEHGLSAQIVCFACPCSFSFLPEATPKERGASLQR